VPLQAVYGSGQRRRPLPTRCPSQLPSSPSVRRSCSIPPLYTKLHVPSRLAAFSVALDDASTLFYVQCYCAVAKTEYNVHVYLQVLYSRMRRYRQQSTSKNNLLLRTPPSISVFASNHIPYRTGAALAVAAPHWRLVLHSVICQSLSDDVVASPAGTLPPRTCPLTAIAVRKFQGNSISEGVQYTRVGKLRFSTTLPFISKTVRDIGPWFLWITKRQSKQPIDPCRFQ